MKGGKISGKAGKTWQKACHGREPEGSFVFRQSQTPGDRGAENHGSIHGNHGGMAGSPESKT
jgi:hypothetical protein